MFDFNCRRMLFLLTFVFFCVFSVFNLFSSLDQIGSCKAYLCGSSTEDQKPED